MSQDQKTMRTDMVVRTSIEQNGGAVGLRHRHRQDAKEIVPEYHGGFDDAGVCFRNNS